MQPLIFIIHVISIAALIALVLVQHGKGADAGAAFSGGASQTMFGSRGSTPFLVKITALMAAIFFITSLSLGYFTAKQAKQDANALLQIPAQSAPIAPMPSLPEKT